MAKNLEERVNELEKEVARLKGKAALKLSKKMEIGDTFTLAGLEWKILDITEKGYMCHAVTHYGKDRVFDSDSNDWKNSSLRKELNTILLETIEAEVGEGNILPFERDLLSMDGQTEYDTCEDKVSLLNVDEYRKYRKLIPNSDKYWWLLTPWSTPCNGYEKLLTVVCPSGNINNNYCNLSRGVRPICITDSQSRHQAEIRRNDTDRCMTFRMAVNTKELMGNG